MSEHFFEFFQKFSQNTDYDLHLSKLKELSEGRYMGEIKIDEHVTIPKYGPDSKIFIYENELKGWSEEDIFDFKFFRDLYFQGAIDSLDFCRLAAAHLSSLDGYRDNESLKEVHYILEDEQEPSIDLIGDLVISDDEQISTLGASLMFTFFT